ncbi:MAG: DHHA1 domain-containing protein [Nanoarchaeota archaeon]
MPDAQAFLNLVKEQSKSFFSSVPEGTIIRVLSHLDADGLSSAAIATATLRQSEYPFRLSILPTLDEDAVKERIDEKDTHIIFLDLGSGQLSLLAEKLGDRHILILDHHELDDACDPKDLPSGFFHVNPHLCGFDGNCDISGSGVTYFWSKVMAAPSDLSALALVGAIGDIQENNGFDGLNKHILEDALNDQHIEQKRMLKMYGAHQKPLVRLLANSDLKIPGISSGDATERFLTSLGISTSIGNLPTKLCDLTAGEMEKLAKAIIDKRKSLTKPDDIYWNSYLLRGEEDGTIRRDAREISTLLNACGRLSKPSVGIGLLLCDDKCRQLASVVHTAYKKKIVESIKWYREQEDDQAVQRSENVIAINAGKNVLPTMIGTLASIIANDAKVEAGTYVLSLADAENGMTKVSVRIAGSRDEELESHMKDIDLSGTMKSIIETFGQGQSGGHAMAAGAVIPQGKEQEFLQIAVPELNKRPIMCAPVQKAD